jgi:hypothetical protein
MRSVRKDGRERSRSPGQARKCMSRYRVCIPLVSCGTGAQVRARTVLIGLWGVPASAIAGSANADGPQENPVVTATAAIIEMNGVLAICAIAVKTTYNASLPNPADRPPARTNDYSRRYHIRPPLIPIKSGPFARFQMCTRMKQQRDVCNNMYSGRCPSGALQLLKYKHELLPVASLYSDAAWMLRRVGIETSRARKTRFISSEQADDVGC